MFNSMGLRVDTSVHRRWSADRPQRRLQLLRRFNYRMGYNRSRPGQHRNSVRRGGRAREIPWLHELHGHGYERQTDNTLAAASLTFSSARRSCPQALAKILDALAGSHALACGNVHH
jgi:hypothetical protein